MLRRLLLPLAVIAVMLVGGIWWDGWLSRIDRVVVRIDGRAMVIQLHRHHGAYYLRTKCERGSHKVLRVADVRDFPAEPMLSLNQQRRELTVNAGGRHVRYHILASGLVPQRLIE